MRSNITISAALTSSKGKEMKIKERSLGPAFVRSGMPCYPQRGASVARGSTAPSAASVPCAPYRAVLCRRVLRCAVLWRRVRAVLLAIERKCAVVGCALLCIAVHCCADAAYKAHALHSTIC